MNITNRDGRPRTAGVLVRMRCVSMLTTCALAMAGCSSAPSTPTLPEATTATPQHEGVMGMLSGMADTALQAVGLKKPEAPALPQVPDSALPDLRVAWRVYASDSLNVDEQGRALALVVRIYRLRSPDAFLQAPYEVFGDAAKEKALLADELVGVREVQLIPGQHYEATDKVAREARYVGIVALYRKPLAGRWRYAFSTTSAAMSGLTIGAHACAMSVQAGEAIGMSAAAVRAVAAPCPQ